MDRGNQRLPPIRNSSTCIDFGCNADVFPAPRVHEELRVAAAGVNDSALWAAGVNDLRAVDQHDNLLGVALHIRFDPFTRCIHTIRVAVGRDEYNDDGQLTPNVILKNMADRQVEAGFGGINDGHGPGGAS